MYTRQCISSNNGESSQASVAVAMAVGVAGILIVLETACSFVCVELSIHFCVCVGIVRPSVLTGFQIVSDHCC